MAGRLHDEGPRHDADDDRWGAVQDVGDESHEKAEPSRAVLGQVQTRADADRDVYQCGDTDDDPGPRDRIGDAATRLSSRDGTPGEERPIDRRRALCDGVAEDERQRRGERQDDDEHRHHPAHEVAAKRARGHSALLPTAAPRATRQIRMRAMALTATVSTKRIRPTSMRADWYVAVVASLNSFAIAAA